MSLLKVGFWFGVVFIYSVLFLYFFHPISNLEGDLGYYLTIGEIIFQTKTVPTINLFSYTHPNFLFINPNWLAEVSFYIVSTIAGFNGLIILSVLLILSAFSFVFITALRKFGAFATIIIALIYLQVLFERTEVKPELFSYLFLSVFIVVLYKYKETFTKWIYMLIPLEILWVNTHIYFFVGIVTVLLFLIDEFFSKKKAVASKKFRTLFFVTVAASAATVINPHFIKGALYPFFVFTNYGSTIHENSNYFAAITSPYINDPTFPFFAVAVVILWLSIFIKRKKLSLIDLLLAAFFTCMGFYAIRNFPLFVIGTFISGVKALSQVISSVANYYLEERIPKKKVLLFQNGFILLLCILLIPIVKTNIGIHGIGFGVVDNTYNAINFIKMNNIKGPLFNNYDIGSYLEYRLYPEYKVFIDGRPEAYPKEFLQNVYYPMLISLDNFNEAAKHYKFNAIFINHRDHDIQATQLLKQLTRSTEWKMVYLDNSTGIFLKNNESNKSLIDKYVVSEATVIITKEDFSDINKIDQWINFFRTVEWEKQWLAMSIRYVELDPKNCAVLENIANYTQSRSDPSYPVYNWKYLQNCRR